MRKDNISILRAITTILVVLYHALGCYTYGWGFPYDRILAYDYFDLFINKINMPLFTAMSGYLYAYGLNNGKYANTWNVMRVKAKRLLIPYVIWSIVQIIIFPDVGVSSIMVGCLHLWFLLMLFGLFCTFSLIRGLLCKLRERTMSVILAAMLLLPIVLRASNLFALNSVISMAVFFYAGMLLQHANIKNMPVWGWMSGLVLGIFGLLFATLYYGRGVSWISEMISRTSSLMVVTTLLFISQDWKIKAGAIIRSIDKNSMGIYILHHIIIWWAVQQELFREAISLHYILAPMVLFMVSLIGAWGITEIVNVFRLKYIFG